MTTQQILLHPFTLGLFLGLIFTALAIYRVFKLKLDIARLKRHLADKLEIEGDSHNKLRRDLDGLRKENENLRVKVAGLNEMPDRKVQRDLEIYARAEKRMLVNVPGFAPAWENAKLAAHTEISDEESGKSIPKRVFAKFFAAPALGKEEKALPASASETPASPES
jgi:hypothetical protein